MKIKISCALMAVAGLLGGGTAFAQSSDVKVSIGLKAWNNTWETSYGIFNGGDLGAGEYAYTAGQQAALIPTLGIRYKDYLLSASYLPNKSYSFPTKDVDREEYDVNFGYFLLPGVAVSLGYKEVKQTFHLKPDQSYTYKTPTVGIQASSKLGDGPFFMYGSCALSIGDSLKYENQTGTTLNGWYSAAEFGLGYVLSNNVTVTVGTKHQVLDIDNKGARMRDVTSGLVAGVAYTF